MMTNGENPQTPPRRINPVLLVLLAIPLLGIIGALITIANSNIASLPPTPLPATQPASFLIGRTGPNFELEALDGGTLRLSSTRGRVVFLNFWATWCEPCIRELPAFAEFMAQHDADTGPLILAINNGETAAQINEFLAANDISGIPIVLDADGEIQRRYEVNFFPTTFVLNPRGIVEDMHVGEMTLDDLNAYAERYGG